MVEMVVTVDPDVSFPVTRCVKLSWIEQSIGETHPEKPEQETEPCSTSHKNRRQRAAGKETIGGQYNRG